MSCAPRILLLEPEGPALAERLRHCSECGAGVEHPVTVGIFKIQGTAASSPAERLGKPTGEPALLCYVCLARFGQQLARVCSALARGEFPRLRAELRAAGSVISE